MQLKRFTERSPAHARVPSDRKSGLPSPLTAALPVASLFLLALLVFAAVTRHQFLNWDDLPAIATNPAYNPPTGASLLRYWTELRPSLQFYVPVTQSIWWTLAAITGRDANGQLLPVPFHAANWFAHALAAVFAYLVMVRLVRDRAASWMGAALFALHPIQVEPVSWASSLYTPLSAAFALAALWQLGRYFDLRYEVDPRQGARESNFSREKRRRRCAWQALALATLCFSAGMLTKPAIVLTPVIAAALEFGFKRRPWRQWVGPVIAWTVLSAPVMVLAKLAQPPATPYWPAWKRPFIATDALTFYASKIVLPVQLATDYGRSPAWLSQSGAWHITWAAPVLAAAGLLYLTVRQRTLRPLACGAAFLAALLPTLGLSPFDYQEYSTVADRYAYFAMFAVGLAAAAALTLPRTPRGRVTAYVASAGVLTTLAILSHVQTDRWRDSLTLFRHTLEVNPESIAGHLVLGEATDRAGDPATAAEHLRLTLEAHPDNMAALSRFGDLALRLGRYNEAVEFYERGIATPRTPPAKMLNNLGGALFKCGRTTEASAMLERAIAIEPQYRDAHLSLAVVQVKQGQWAAARSHFEAASKLDPKSDVARQGLNQLKSMGH